MKIPFKKKKKGGIDLEQIKNHLEKNNECYVLITCSRPSKEGKMQVELNYSGDENLVSYLLEGAQGVFDNKMNKVKDNC